MTGPEAAAAYAAMYGPLAANLTQPVAASAEALSSQLCELAKRPTVERADAAAITLNGALRIVLQMRVALIREGKPQ